MALDDCKEVVLISDDLMIGKLLSFLLRSQGLMPKLENNISKGIEYVESRKPETSLLIFDLNYKSDEGLMALDAIRQFDASEAPSCIVLSTCEVDCDDCSEFIKDNYFYFKKPFSTKQLIKKIKEIVEEA